ncbi:cellulose synthase/poly-beta-1,6-N-acetylglucosamine synthase-like glycosyltransferase [Mucilaginibacter oryzae]|uniref:Cellulose synthase/poly-beta-1,6-N-acetylglucosamine synthase-like glycosyltransferase n=1 Tax=Mucilaginibacter oryzae TaxID=468058 RepID=A0A316GYT6_9SPHI|nr:glycosyltransferase [Mucilaginibacter oryzae]PWK70815.1 cellulose synthase/poly-beta-1,6-N-acetylglucosamine synthase-like glycosyltransferase [Mucilaginibacter oryzae]
MIQHIIDIFQWFIFSYSTVTMAVYVTMAVLSYKHMRLYSRKNIGYYTQNVISSPLSPGISVIAPAYNEGLTIIDNVFALMHLNYPLYEVIIINDGSTDDTLEKLISRFDLREVDLPYHERIKTLPVKRFFRSRDKAYDKLLVIDKENGKGKADASNAGINASKFDYFLCTDVDCILHEDTLSRLMRPILDEKSRNRLKDIQVIPDTGYIHVEDGQRQVIAVGAPLRMINSSDVDNGVITRFRPPSKLLPRFQELEYIRAYLLSKMAWSSVNCVPNVSGGLGLFDKRIAVKVGGYDPRSFAEDIDIVTRMSVYMIQNNKRYAIRYIPVSLCWTEGPQTLKVFSRQRVRWARGLIQIMRLHSHVLFNPKFKRLGMVVFPYNFLFEFLAPMLETIGLIFYIYLIAIGAINWRNTFILLCFLYMFSVLISAIAVLWDQLTERHYRKTTEVIGLCLTAFAEPFIYHPLIVFFSLKGYVQSLFRKKLVWGNMQRKGFSSSTVITDKA